MLVVVGGPRSARRAGQLAQKTGTPILFLPGIRDARWARHLWGPLSLEDMISAIARGELTPVRLGVGMAEDQIFFEQARFGLLPHLPELRQALDEADTFAEGWQVITRTAQLSRLLLAPNVHFHAGDSNHQSAKGLTVTVPTPDTQLVIAAHITLRSNARCRDMERLALSARSWARALESKGTAKLNILAASHFTSRLAGRAGYYWTENQSASVTR
jgi:hypothetical protein